MILMVQPRGVAILVDENFFKKFDRERQKEQERLRKKFGSVFNLTQRKFTAILMAKKFQFNFPKKRIIRRRRKIR